MRARARVSWTNAGAIRKPAMDVFEIRELQSPNTGHWLASVYRVLASV
jgi:hypothetical protein